MPRSLRIGVAVLLLSAIGCSSSATSSTPPSATASPAAPLPSSSSATGTSYDVFQVAFCDSFTSLIRAVGNPDTNTPSVLSKALDEAVKAGDVAGADQAATKILAELETGRLRATAAAGWTPGAPLMAHMDRLLLAFEAQVTAKRAAAAHLAGAVEPQAAFEHAGGVEAWGQLLDGLGHMALPSGEVARACPAFSGQV